MPASRIPLIFLLLSLLGCAPAEDVEIRFDAVLGERPLRCGDGGTVLSDLRFFVHDLEVVDADGRAAPVRLAVVPGWQTRDLALVDLEDGTASCLNGTADTRATVQGSVPRGDWRGLRFVLGVPAGLNHGDPLTAEGPLTRTAMHWHWRSGYKFLRAGLARGPDGAWLHLGSARCSGVIGRLEGCAAGNRARVVLDDFRLASDVVGVDAGRLFAAADLDDGVVDSCQMGPDEGFCALLLEPLGLGTDGDSVAPAGLFVTTRGSR